MATIIGTKTTLLYNRCSSTRGIHSCTTLVGAGAFAVIWLILLWMHRRRIFVRI